MYFKAREDSSSEQWMKVFISLALIISCVSLIVGCLALNKITDPEHPRSFGSRPPIVTAGAGSPLIRPAFTPGSNDVSGGIQVVVNGMGFFQVYIWFGVKPSQTPSSVVVSPTNLYKGVVAPLSIYAIERDHFVVGGIWDQNITDVIPRPLFYYHVSF